MNELEINCYNFWFDWLEKKFFKKPDGIIYLRCSPDKCLERMKQRSRSEESHVPLEYLEELHSYNENWLKDWEETPLLIIDNDMNDNWENILNQVNLFIK